MTSEVQKTGVSKRLYLASTEVFLAVVCVLIGISFLPWGIVLTLGGGIELGGIVSGAIRIRRAGLLLLTAGSTVVLAANMTLIGFLIYVAFIWAVATRYYELGRTLKCRDNVIKER
jgi:hypothetical protein